MSEEPVALQTTAPGGDSAKGDGRRLSTFTVRYLGAISWAWPLFSILFTATGIVSYLYSQHQFEKSTDLDLSRQVQSIGQELRYTDHWLLREYRQSFVNAEHSLIVSTSGTVIDIDGFLPGLIGGVLSVPGNADGEVTSIRSDLGEAWRVLSRKIQGGTVVVGISDPEDLKEAADILLKRSAAKFGTTLGDALRTRSDIDREVETAVIAADGNLLDAMGGIPLSISSVPISGPDTFERRINSRFYRIRRATISSPNGEPMGVIFVYRDVTPSKALLRSQSIFDAGLAAISWLIALGIVLKRERSRERKPRDLGEALAIGENEEIEFKSGFQVGSDKQVRNEWLRSAVIETVAGFLNTSGGDLFLGVKDDGTVSGIDEDLRFVQGSRDKFQRAVADALSEKVGRSFAKLWQIKFEDHDGKTVCVMFVQKSSRPVFVRGEKGSEFFVRSAARTIALDPKDTFLYLQRRRVSLRQSYEP